MYAHLNTTHKLTVTLTGRKSGSFHYKVVEKSTGNIVAERRGNRKYVAATICGNCFYGRVDLAQKQKPFFGGSEIGFYQPVIAYLEDQPPFEL